MKRYLAVAILSLVILFAAGCERLPKTMLVPDPKLTILSHEWTTEYVESLDEWKVKITGIAINDGSRRLRYAEIRARIYSSTGRAIGENFTEITGLDKYALWQFKIVEYVDLAPDHYRIWVGKTVE